MLVEMQAISALIKYYISYLILKDPNHLKRRNLFYLIRCLMACKKSLKLRIFTALNRLFQIL